jgi:hypothetical protein
VRAGLEGRRFPPPADPVRLTQDGCRYEPRVFGIQAGQPLEIVNADPVSHTIHALAKRGRPFNAGMPGKRAAWSIIRRFSAEEIPVRIRCDVHPWMIAWAGVTTHPFHAVTDARGRFTLRGLPPGSYELAAWHERFGIHARRVTVRGDGAAPVRFDFVVSSSDAGK